MIFEKGSEDKVQEGWAHAEECGSEKVKIRPK